MGDSLFDIMKGIIYKATNLFNGMSYIGQTTTSLRRRMSQHLRDAVSDTVNHFHLALMQYGKDAFEWSILDEFEGSKESVIHALNVAEEYHILKNRTILDECGYNATQGGYSSDKFADIIKKRVQANYGGKAILQYDLDGNFIKVYDSIADVKRCFGVEHHKGKYFIGKMWRGYQWREKVNEYYPLKIEKYKVSSKPCVGLVVYYPDGRFYKEYASLSELRKEMGRGFAIREGFGKVSIKSHKRDAYIVFRKTIADYPTSIEVDIICPKSNNDKPSYSTQSTPILQYSTDGKFIKEFKSIGEAHKETGVARSSISNSCKKDVPYAVDIQTKWIWRYNNGSKQDQIEVYARRSKRDSERPKKEHKIIQYDVNGNLVKIHKNLSIASTDSGVGVSVIRRGLKGAYFQGDIYQWMPFCEDYKQVIGKIRYKRKNYVHIAQYDTNGNLIKIWENMYQASLQTGESHNLIRKQCMGISTKKKTPSTWKYYQ